VALALDAKAPEAFTPAMIRALAKHDVPATTAATPGAFQLELRLEEAKSSSGLLLLGLLWEIRDAKGLALGHHEQRARLQEGPWRAGDEPLMRSIAGEAAQALAKLLLENENAPAPEPAKTKFLRIALEPITGAPGDGADSLRIAIKASLKLEQIEAIEDPGDSDVAYVLSARVKVTPAGKGTETVTLVWTLFDLDGRELGQVEQENALPAGRLSGRWGEAATMAAQGAAMGLTDLIRRTRRGR
jgi:hypothetical protein